MIIPRLFFKVMAYSEVFGDAGLDTVGGAYRRDQVSCVGVRVLETSNMKTHVGYAPRRC